MTFRSPEKLLDELGITEPEEIDLEAIAYHVDALVVERNLDGCAARIVGSDKKAIISVPPGGSVGRRRFSIGHELGHWMRDRGKATHLCQKNDLRAPWDRSDPESLANAYAADLLMPHFMFKPRAEGRDITFDTVRELKEKFATSWTATALRLVQLGSFPSVVARYNRQGRRWFTPSPDLHWRIWPVREVHHETHAFERLYGGSAPARPIEVSAGYWIDSRGAYRHTVYEHAIKIDDESVLVLLWWKKPSDVRELLG